MCILLSVGEEEVNMSHWVITEHDSKTEEKPRTLSPLGGGG